MSLKRIYQPRFPVSVNLVGVFFVLLLVGCAENIRPYSSQLIGTESVYTKNYNIGEERTAAVGEPIVKVKDYSVIRYSSKIMRPSADFYFEGGLVKTKGSKGDEYSVIGSKDIDGTNYQLLDIAKDTNHLLLISSSGEVYPKILGRVPGGSAYVFVRYRKLNPPEVKFISTPVVTVDTVSGYINYELIYSGIDKNTLHLTYREFTQDNLARAPFFQNLTYSASADTIRFKNTRIAVKHATSEGITYTVVDDNLSK